MLSSIVKGKYCFNLTNTLLTEQTLLYHVPVDFLGKESIKGKKISD